MSSNEPYTYHITVEKHYNDLYGDDKVCICGNEYRMHFSTWYEVSRTYNGCNNFILKPQNVPHPDEARQRGAKDAINGLPVDEQYCSVNKFIDESYRKGYDKKNAVTLEWEDIESIDWWESDGIEIDTDEDDDYTWKFSDGDV